jgi:hypothetical protein
MLGRVCTFASRPPSLCDGDKRLKKQGKVAETGGSRKVTDVTLIDRERLYTLKSGFGSRD